MIQITADILKQIAPGSKKTNYRLIDSLAQELNTQLYANQVDTHGEVCHFISQAAVETDSFNSLIEYNSGEAYEMRRDLGNIVKGWGVRYKGRGVFDTTGYTNYKRLSDLAPEGISFITHPELLEKPKWAVWAACIFWNDRHLSDIANMNDGARVFTKRYQDQPNKGMLAPIEYITYRVNGGLNGLDQRMMFYQRAKQFLPVPNT